MFKDRRRAGVKPGLDEMPGRQMAASYWFNEVLILALFASVRPMTPCFACLEYNNKNNML